MAPVKLLVSPVHVLLPAIKVAVAIEMAAFIAVVVGTATLPE
jgi:hypothetical protein